MFRGNAKYAIDKERKAKINKTEMRKTRDDALIQTWS